MKTIPDALKIGPIHRNRFVARIAELPEVFGSQLPPG
jgi:hypothetical protein